MHLPTNTCSDGMGRSGTFICIHSQLERLKTEGVVDIFHFIKSARIHRPQLVETVVSVKKFIVKKFTVICILAHLGSVHLLP